MNKRTLIIFGSMFALASVLTILAHAQQAPSPMRTQPPPETQAPPVSPEMQATLDGQGPKRYLVGPADILDVRVFGQPDLNSTVEIDDEGNISSLPFLEEPLPAMCHTEKEIQKIIAEAYSKYLRKPRVSVRVLTRNSRPPAVVYGAVRAPTRIQMMRRVRLHELLVAAGGITQGASGTIQIIHTEKELCLERGGITQDSPISVSDVQTTTSDKADPGSTYTKPSSASAFDTLVTASASKPTSNASVKPEVTTEKPEATTASEKPDAASDPDKPKSDIGQIEIFRVGDVRTGLGRDDPYIRPGDIVIVVEGEPIWITGAVMSPNVVTMKEGMSLATAIAMAGGVQKLAKSKEIHIYRRKEAGKPGIVDLTFDYEAIRKGQKPDVLLQALDIIDVRPMSQWSPKALGDFFLNITRGSLGGIGGSLPYRVMY